MTEKITQIKHQLEYSLHDTSKPWTQLLAQAEQKTGVGRLYLAFGNYIVQSCSHVENSNNFYKFVF